MHLDIERRLVKDRSLTLEGFREVSLNGAGGETTGSRTAPGIAEDEVVNEEEVELTICSSSLTKLNLEEARSMSGFATMLEGTSFSE